MKSHQSKYLLILCRPSTYPITFVLTLYICVLLTGAHKASKAPPPPPPANCIVCDSQKDPVCREDEPTTNNTSSTNNATGLAQFQKLCGDRQNWCYKAEGKIKAVTFKGKEYFVWKVDRGCAKQYYNETCARVKQEDETDFRVCYCNATHKDYCNGDIDVWDRTVDNRSGRQHSNLWEVLGLGLLHFLLSLLFTRHIIQFPSLADPSN